MAKKQWKSPFQPYPYERPVFSRKKDWRHSAKKSIYYWWFEYLSRNDVYRETCANNGTGSAAALYKDFGNVCNIEFKDWWIGPRALYLFGDFSQFTSPIVVNIRKTQEFGDGFIDAHIFIAVPTIITKKNAEAAIKKILNKKFKAKRGIQLARRSYARYVPSTPPKFETLERDLVAYDLRISNPKLKLWEIAYLVPHPPPNVDLWKREEGEKSLDGNLISERREVMTGYVNRWIRQARKRIANTLEGKFP